MNYFDSVTVRSFCFDCFEEFYAGEKFQGILDEPHFLNETFYTCVSSVACVLFLLTSLSLR